jgi:hypothetical protein
MQILQRDCAGEDEASYLRQLALLVMVHDVSGWPVVLGSPLFSEIASVCGLRPPADGWLPDIEHWQQCIFERHAFFMAPRSPPTEVECIGRALLLWAGIKAGSVPVLFSPVSQNPPLAEVLAFLSAPLAIVSASSFLSAAEKAGHLSAAQTEPAVLEMHQRWRRELFAEKFLAALQDLPARLPCRVCHNVAEQQQHSPVTVGARRNSLVLPA